MSEKSLRRPQVFEPTDPRVEPIEPLVSSKPDPSEHSESSEWRERAVASVPTSSARSRGLGWGAVLFAALTGLVTLAAGVAVTRFVRASLARDDIIGWIAMGLVAVAIVATAAIVLREAIGLARLRRLGSLRRDAEALIAGPDAAAERVLATRLAHLLAQQPSNSWALARFREHRRDVQDPGALLRLADRELCAPLDRVARRMVLASAKRVATVTALSPIAVISVGYVLAENLGLMRRLAALYGGRPGLVGGLRLGRLVIGHLVATGGIAMTDDLLGQFLGQDLVRRLSRRLGEGVFNGALTARLGVVAIDVCRPLPFVEAPPIRARDIVTEVFRTKPTDA